MHGTLPKKNWPPNYTTEFGWRQRKLLSTKDDAVKIYQLLEYYKQRGHCAEFIQDWMITFDPRNATSSTGLPTKMPFIFFKRQKELVEFILDCMFNEADGLIEKCRDMGATWICCAISIWAWRFLPGMSIGWGSRKEQLVDKLGDPDSIFEKMRMIIKALPEFMLPVGFDHSEHMAFMRIINPENGATITGEAGDNIGRGGRKSIYFKDESAHYEHAESIEAALMDNTRVQIDISSVHGIGNVFHRRRENGKDWVPGAPVEKGRTNVLVLDWTDHPEKDQAWFDAKKKKARDDGLMHVFAQEVERNYSASVIGTIIPAEWVTSAIDAHVKLGIPDTGGWGAALDVAGESVNGDTNALALRKGIVLRSCDEWGEVDTGITTQRAIAAVRHLGRIDLQYDSVSVGEGVKAESNRLRREGDMPKTINFVSWHAGAGVLHPERRVIPNDKESPLNKDFYLNLKAQAWWEGRRRFEITHRAVTEKGFVYNPDDLISLDSSIPLLQKLRKELSQATIKYGAKLKLVVDKAPEGTKSPNLADSVIMAYWPVNAPALIIPAGAMARAMIKQHAGARR